jgi:hypothetical protein
MSLIKVPRDWLGASPSDKMLFVRRESMWTNPLIWLPLCLAWLSTGEGDSLVTVAKTSGTTTIPG